MPFLLGLHGVPEAEISLVRTIVRLSSSLRPGWEVADAGACDLVILDASLSVATLPAERIAAVHSRLQQRGQAVGERDLERPIRAEALVELLNRIANHVLGAAPQQAGEPALAAPPAAAFLATTGIPAFTAGTAARLKRWPSWKVLKDRPQALQMATFLSKAAYTPERLALSTGRPVDQCRAFLDELEALGLLAWQAVAASATPAQKPAAPAAQRGLLKSIRRRLGLA